MKIAIVDDETKCQEEIMNLLREFYVERNIMIDTFKDGNKLIEKTIIDYDIVFIDIEMPTIDGISLSNLIIEKKSNIFLIYVTSHFSYVSKAVRNHAFQFLTKPIIKEELFCDLERVDNCILEGKERIEVVVDGLDTYLIIKDISYIESLNKKLIIHTINGAEYVVVMQLSKILEKLKDKNFMQVHKSFVVNYECVFKVSSDTIFLTNNNTVPISRKYKDKFMIELNKFMNSTRLI